MMKTPAVDELVHRSLELRKELMPLVARVDALGGDTTEGMRRCFEEGSSGLRRPNQTEPANR